MNKLTENNKLLAEFMGYIPVQCRNGFAWDIGKSTPSKDLKLPIQGKLITEECEYLLFNTDWNWLFKVVEKIESLGFKFNITTSDATTLQNHGVIYQTLIYRIDGLKKIDAVYKTCVEFVNWYNDQKIN